MGQVEGSPRGVVEGDLLRVGDIRFKEAPAKIEIVLTFQLRGRGGRRVERRQLTARLQAFMPDIIWISDAGEK